MEDVVIKLAPGLVGTDVVGRAAGPVAMVKIMALRQFLHAHGPTAFRWARAQRHATGRPVETRRETQPIASRRNK